MDNAIQKEFNFIETLKFSMPTVLMMLFTATYTMVDGMFVARYVGESALSALNIAYPAFNFVLAVGIMLGAGSSALVGKQLGEKKFVEAKNSFTLIVVLGVVLGILITSGFMAFMEPLMLLLGANDELLKLCMEYSYVVLLFSTSTILQMIFQYLIITAGHPNLGFALSLFAGLTNIVLDFLFIVPLNMGIIGAALATGIGTLIPALCGFIFFVKNKDSGIGFAKLHFDFYTIHKSVSNGASEMVTEVSNAVITFLYNIVMIRLAGSTGVAAITIVLYLDFLLKAVFLGFSMGVAPLFSYNYGSQNILQLKRLFRYCMCFIVICSSLAFIFSVVCAPYLVLIFVKKSSEVFPMALMGFKLYSFSFLFTGISIFSSAMFTAFSNGKISVAISFPRTFLFIFVGLLTLPKFFGMTGAWLSTPVAEGLAMVLSVALLLRYRKVYHYL